MDDAPPPPYSPHDPHGFSLAQPSNSPPYFTAFNVFRDGTAPLNLEPSARQSSREDSILAPPFPTTPSLRPNGIPIEQLDRAVFLSAAAYFETRAPVQARPHNTVYHRMSISLDACPDSLPFPQPMENWTSRDVNEQDWMTFLNHMFPPHEAGNIKKNSHELEADASLRLNNSRSRDQARPLLGGNRPGPSAGGQDSELERFRRLRLEAVSSQWNEGFFGIRGLEILINITNSTSSTLVETPSRRRSGNVLQKQPPPEADQSLLHQLVAKGKKSQLKLLLEEGSEDIEALNKNQETCLFRAVSRGEKDIVQLLLQNNADPTARPPGSESPLHIACYHDRKSIIKLLLEKSRAGIEEQNSKGETPLYVALQRRHSSCVEVLLDAGANPNARPVGRDSMLHVAVSNDSKSIAKCLLQRGADIEELKGGETPLFRAVSKGQTSMVKLLLEYGASAAARTSKGEAPLSQAVARGDRTTVSLLLARKDIDIEVENEKHETPLWTSIHRGYTSIAEQLLKKGADPDKIPPGGEHLVNMAVGRGSTSLTNLLLERGANFEEKNRSGESPLFQAVSRGDTSIVSLLLVKGASADTCNPAGESALQRAVARSSTSIVSLLLARGADPDLKIASGESPLYIAASRKSTSIVSILLSHGANPEGRSLNGELPLNRAIYVASTSIVSLLLSSGADPAAKTLNGDTMMDYALKRGDKTIIQLLSNILPPKPSENGLSG